jgi:hypothetical protein
MEWAAVDRKARAASLQDELNATEKEIERASARHQAMACNPGLCGGGFLGLPYSTSKRRLAGRSAPCCSWQA